MFNHPHVAAAPLVSRIKPQRAGAALSAAVLAAVLSALCATSAQAYDKVVVFGDSLSDNGNLAQKFGGAVPAASVYNQGRFTNGPVAVEVLANQLGLPLEDHAYGGAMTGASNQFEAQNPLVANTGMQGQVSSYLATQSADANALYVVWGGGNDFLAAIASGNFAGMGTVVGTAVSNLVGEVSSLYAAGARSFLVPTLPDLATTFYGTSGAFPGSVLSGLSSSFNAALSAQMNALKATRSDMSLTVFDTPGVLSGIRSGLAAAGGNVTDRCWTGDYSGAANTTALCTEPGQYYLFDKVHPTAYVHDQFGKAMASAVPEPLTSGLMLVGLITMSLVLPRRKGARVGAAR
jgi:phospholipase/lecithinase/hemolysin